MKEKSLLIVESPSKAKTINKILGPNFIVKASMGHIKDLPAKKLGVNLENFEPDYVFIKGRKDLLKDIKKTASGVKNIYLAPDPDREGEMICWHLKEELKNICSNIYRVIFNEITKKAVINAVAHPGEVDTKKVNAQQARRVLDRIVGYMLSPLLWKKVRKGLSAGRVQSVAVRLICEREKDIENFVKEEYWEILAELETDKKERFQAKLDKKDNIKLKIENQEQNNQIIKELDGAAYQVSNIEKKTKKKSTLPPFITSKLQQEAVRKLGFTPKKTMMIAQQLYEGLTIEDKGTVGLITYMRTDSTRISDEAIQNVREYINNKFGNQYLPEKPNIFKNAKSAQEAHEAIRPTIIDMEPDKIKNGLTPDQYKLYSLIWKRFIASQMTPQVFDVTTAYIQAKNYTFIAVGSIIIEKGFTAVYEETKNNNGSSQEDDSETPNVDKFLPRLVIGENLLLIKLDPSQHFTKPPARYNEATLVKALEENGIGRPSTYASIITTIQNRDYVEKKDRCFYPTELGKTITTLLVQSFPDILNVEFTANMENELDQIEEGKNDKDTALKEFYKSFSRDLDNAKTNMRNIKKEMEVETDIICENCGKKMVTKWGRHGKFLACPGFPECKNTKP
ncbi:MAG: type I DNA topoisomerase, partial [Candidatus Firestonebacteria bacterium]|nr:type I DNA topoisomerase [Candidatus Firestonebacteria bacterium]